MLKLEIFDSQMCCSTGICGSIEDSTFVTFASDLEWLKVNGVDVLRHGISFEPTEFIKNEAVKCLLNSQGNRCLPLILVDGELAFKGSYPSREKLAEICKIEFNDDEAPPVHREENCCCGVDCDCSSLHLAESVSSAIKCECKSGLKNESCICGEGCDSEVQKTSED